MTPPRPLRSRPAFATVTIGALMLGLAACLTIVTGSVPEYGDGAVGPGDAWRFNVALSGPVTLEAQSTTADLVLELYDETGRFLAAADDEIACPVPLPCGFQCPQLVQNLEAGLYFVVVRDFGDSGCGGGDYTLTIETPGGDLEGVVSQVFDDEPVATPEGRVPSKG